MLCRAFAQIRPWTDRKRESVTSWMDDVWDGALIWKEPLPPCVQEWRKISSRCQMSTWGNSPRTWTQLWAKLRTLCQALPCHQCWSDGSHYGGKAVLGLESSIFSRGWISSRGEIAFGRRRAVPEKWWGATLFIFSSVWPKSEVQFDPIKGYSEGASPAQSRLTDHCSSWQIYMRFLVSHTSQLMSFSSVYQPSPSGVEFHWLFISPLLKGRVDISGCLDFFVVVLLVLFFCRSQLWRACVISQSKVRQLYRSNN